MTHAHLPSNVIPCRPAHLVYIAGRMRECERAQFLAVTGGRAFDADTATNWLINTAARSQGYAFTVLCADNMPAAAGGFEPILPGVWQSWMAGTPEGWAEQWRSMTKATRWLMDRIFEAGAHRLQTTALTSRGKALEWFERSLHLRPEGVWRGFGANGEDFAAYSRLRGE